MRPSERGADDLSQSAAMGDPPQQDGEGWA